MIRSGLRPDLWTFNSILHCLFRSGNPGLVSRVLNWMEEEDLKPSRVTYNILLDGLCRSGDAGGALDLLRKLENVPGNPKSVVAFNIVINGLCKCGKIREARGLFRELNGSGIMPNLVTYTIMMKSFFRSGRFREGFCILDEMKREGFRLDPFVYCTVIGAMLKIGKLEEASELFDKIEGEFFKDTVFLNNQISFYFKQGNVEEALDLLNQVEEVDDYTVSILIDGLCKNDRLADAYHILKYMVTTRSNSNPVPYNCFIQGLCKKGKRENVDFAMNLFNSLEKKDSFAYSAVLRGLSRSGRFLEAFTVMASGLREGVRLPRSVRRMVLAGLRSMRFKMHARKLRWEIVKAKFGLP